VKAVRDVETWFVSDPALRFNVMVPGPVNVTDMGFAEPEHASPFEQFQPVKV
jgi:hypothetical protein